MQQLIEYFSPTKLAELETKVASPYGFRMARQELEVYNNRDALAMLADKIEELRGITAKVEEIQKFAEDNGLEDMVSFCCWNNAEYEIDNILQADVQYDAMKWMRSNHDC
ncbi:hypothetical protein PJKIFABJ_00164 [Pseudomonas phage PE09]|uniref:Uncharacterized protein n=3 Tax=Otagovirus TaxID=2560197 RepID=A0A7S7YDI6_9CAUD|nr:hypothetical protein QGX21_gp085 [Pseudomonas phage phiPsa315]YP_010768274.1 hypothetical protein QGX22_gp090 [Pseudomonas phage PE09]YP_010768451.1 hypothetical protein QGX23_gp088 [Pseudomonas phage PN09]QHZ60100.1 hypothetical protein PJKIFABJ_00164 [Pseudomonas phage PE09]QNO00298.1 hypothetical protein phiPsa315_141 [Pseudomonas phage phiPsa315]QPB10564.1 hypothetical protein PN09_143 [Pseudomonas phage PN09]